MINRNDEVRAAEMPDRVAGPVGRHLTTPAFWDDFWSPRQGQTGRSSLLGRFKSIVRSVVGEQRLQLFTRSYSDYILWEHLYRRCLPPLEGAKVLEIGSAPGDYLVRLSRTFGCIPYGVEYSPVGFETNQRTFERNGLNPGTVVFADAFSDSFQDRFRGFFDLVISRGVIEHFSDIRPILAKHYALIRPGGSVVVSVPNFRGVNRLLMWIFDVGSLRTHNLEIMRKAIFQRAFQATGFHTVYCGYYGTCDVCMCISGPHSKRGLAFELFDKTQVALNGAFRLILRGRGLESGALSPFLLYAGTRGEDRAEVASTVH